MSVSRKNLPKAITRPTEDMREAIAAGGARAQQEVLARSMDFNALSDRDATAPEPGPAIVDATPAPPPSPPPVATALARTAPPPADIHAARRRSLARTVVERHAAYAAVGGVIPLPIANVASITAVIVRMVRMLSDLYGVPFERDRARAIVIGLMGGAMPTGLGAVTTSTLVYVVPGSGLIGLAVSSIAAAACTRSIGRIFVEHFESGATLQDLPATGTT
jgi:uncharacterized protein (DUF697 family)